MKPDDIFDAVGEVSDAYVADAGCARRSKKTHIAKWCSVAACLALVIGAFILIYPGGNAGSGAGTGLTYMSYAGPVFPLTVRESADGISATRDITLDFADYAQAHGTFAAVKDAYTLKNTTENDITVTAMYPYAANASDVPPVLEINGEKVEMSLYFGSTNGRFSSFADYETLLKDGSYPDCVFESTQSLDIPVYVYRLHDYVYTKDPKAGNPTLQFSFNLDYDKTFVYSYNMNGGVYDVENGYAARSCSSIKIKDGNIDEKYKYPSDAFVIICGEDIDSYKLQGYRDGGCDKGEEVDDLTCTVTRYETTFGEIIEHCLNDFAANGYSVTGGLETYKSLVAALLGENGKLLANGPEGGMLEDIFSHVRTSQRIIYAAVEVTIPSGGTIDVVATLQKPASVDYVGEETDRNGYAVAARLGSCLSFESQTATVTNFDFVEIIRNNFGFDLENGKTTVSLDPSTDHYYIDIRKKQG